MIYFPFFFFFFFSFKMKPIEIDGKNECGKGAFPENVFLDAGDFPTGVQFVFFLLLLSLLLLLLQSLS